MYFTFTYSSSSASTSLFGRFHATVFPTRLFDQIDSSPKDKIPCDVKTVVKTENDLKSCYNNVSSTNASGILLRGFEDVSTVLRRSSALWQRLIQCFDTLVSNRNSKPLCLYIVPDDSAYLNITDVMHLKCYAKNKIIKIYFQHIVKQIQKQYVRHEASAWRKSEAQNSERMNVANCKTKSRAMTWVAWGSKDMVRSEWRA